MKLKTQARRALWREVSSTHPKSKKDAADTVISSTDDLTLLFLLKKDLPIFLLTFRRLHSSFSLFDSFEKTRKERKKGLDISELSSPIMQSSMISNKGSENCTMLHHIIDTLMEGKKLKNGVRYLFSTKVSNYFKASPKL